MGLRLWKKNHILRRFSDVEMRHGYPTTEYEDIIIKADFQTTDNRSVPGLDGDYGTQRIKVFTDFEVKIADSRTGIPGDHVWHQGKWFECQSSRLSENTFLKHYTSTFVECQNQPAPPGKEVMAKL